MRKHLMSNQHVFNAAGQRERDLRCHDLIFYVIFCPLIRKKPLEVNSNQVRLSHSRHICNIPWNANRGEMKVNFVLHHIVCVYIYFEVRSINIFRREWKYFSFVYFFFAFVFGQILWLVFSLFSNIFIIYILKL